MKFDYEKFRQQTNFSDRYANWNKSLLEVLEQAGDSHPTYDYHAHIFSLGIEREPTPKGRRRGSIPIHIICPNDGEIQIKVDEKIKPDEIQIAVEKAVKFISVLEKAGYISESE